MIRPMTITTFTILNGIVALVLLTGLALVMLGGHRAAGSERTGTRHWSDPLEVEPALDVSEEPELERAA
jgi:hypothetical protein